MIAAYAGDVSAVRRHAMMRQSDAVALLKAYSLNKMELMQLLNITQRPVTELMICMVCVCEL